MDHLSERVVTASADVRPRYEVGGVGSLRPFAIQRLGHVGINVRDLDASLTFYRDLLGLRHTDVLTSPAVEHPIGHFTTFGSDHHSFLLVDERFGSSDEERARGGMTFNQISFQVGTLAEVVAAHGYFTERKRAIWKVGRDSPGSNWAVYAFDPDGHRIELFYGMEQIGWDRLSKPRGMAPGMTEAPALPRVAEAQEIEAWTKQGRGSLHTGQSSNDPRHPAYDVGGVLLPRPFKIIDQGPLMIYVSDVDESAAYYQDVYGMALTETTEFEGHRCSFLRVNSHHHALALLPAELRARLGGGSRSSAFAFGFRLGSYSQLRAAVEFLRANGVEVDTGLHRELHPGIEEAAYVTDLDGNRVLLYCAIEQIGWDGRPRPAHTRRPIPSDWPQVIEGATAAFDGQTFLGPLG